MKRSSSLFARTLAIVFLLFSAATTSAAQSDGGFTSSFGQSASKAKASLYSRVEEGRVRVAIEIEIDEGWHLYHTELGHPEAIGKTTEIELSGEGIEWGELSFPEPHRIDQPFEGVTVLTHEGTIVVRASGVLAEGATGEDVGAKITGQTCEEDGTCVLYDETLASEGPGEDALFPAPPAKSSAFENFTPTFTKVAGNTRASLYSRVDGERVEALIELEIKAGWHIYHTELGDPEAIGKVTEVEFTGAGIEWGEVRFPEPHVTPQPFPGVTALTHSGTILIRAEGELADGFSGEDIGAKISGSTCEDDGSCVLFSETLASKGRGDDALFAQESSGGHSGDSESDSGGLLGFLLSAVGWGLFTLLMPCTYPMIPITISFFTKQAADKKGSALPLSLAYGLGIIAIFVVIGVVFGSVIIPFATHPITNIVIGVLFFYFALVLFGVVNLQPPKALLDLAGKASQMGGYLGVFLMGATLVITSFTCTAPFVGTLLATGAEGGDLVRIALGMGVFGLTMALPFVALSMVPGKMQAMPRSGEWMNTLKTFLGFIELAAALKFISNSDLSWGWNIISREIFLGSWIAIFIVAALFLFGLLPGKRAKPGAIRILSGVGMLSLTAYCIFGLQGGQLDRITVSFVPPYSGGVLLPEKAGKEKLYITDDYEGAMQRALDENKLLLVNFTGHT